MESFIFSAKKLFEQFKVEFLLLAGALCLAIVSAAVLYKSQIKSEPAFKITEENTKTSQSSISVDIEGAVRKPGLYNFEKNARLKDLIAKAGGLSDSADKYYFAKNFNLASLLKDQEKIYIPSSTESEISTVTNQSRESSNGLISINNGSREELDSLSGVGATTIDKIIAGRPYQNIDELLSKKILKSGVYENVKDQLSL